ncbi:MAG: MASE1 domain-containing protein, partial [Elusimicrobia bacterium]|nr:MASE1 domain-containing protein [Elusimicrobiota bacterium]
MAGIAAVYFLAAKFGLSLAFVNKQVTAVWPPSGIALVALLLFGISAWPGVALGAFAINALAGTPATALGISAGNTLEAVAGAYMLRRYARFDNSLERLRDVLGLIGFAALLSPLVAATFGVVSLCLGGMPWAQFFPVWGVWWLGDALGNLIAAPLLLTWTAQPALAWRGWRLAELLLLAAGLSLVGQAIFTARIAPASSMQSFPYLIFPFIIWAALRFRQRETATAVFLIAGFAIWGALHNVGPFALGTFNERLNVLQAFMGVSAVTALILGAATAEREKAGELFRIVIEEAPSAMVMTADDGKIVMANAQAEMLFGYAPRELVGQPVETLVPLKHRSNHPGLRAGFYRHREARPMGAGRDLLGARKDGGEVPVEIGLTPLNTGQGNFVLAAIVDISQRKHAEERIRKIN